MKPKIFISSTIYDFRDLRSALKFYFEQFDFSVQLSEFNDFQKKLDLNSYDSCLNEIHNSDYFILLIGSRVGGWFDEINKISITRKEYETAYELAREGKLKLLIFVRDEIWTIREDRKALKKYLQSEKTFSSELSASDMIKITNYPSNLN